MSIDLGQFGISQRQSLPFGAIRASKSAEPKPAAKEDRNR
jgi:hypothetical protein